MNSEAPAATTSEVRRTPDERFVALPDFPYTPHYREWEGIRLAHVDEGEGPAVVMLHGEPSWSYLYRKVIPPLLAAGYRCIAADLPGFGRSDKPVHEDWYSYDRHTAAISSLLVDLDLHDVCMVMHDWGGPIGLRVSMLEVPERVSRLVVMDAGVLTGQQEMGPTWRSFRDMVSAMPDFPVARMVRIGCRTKPSKEVLAAYDAPFPDSGSKAGPRAFPRLVPLTPDAPGAQAGQATLEALRDDRRPALLLWADSDPMFPVERFAHDMHEQFGHRSELSVIADAGHFLQEDRGEEIGRRIARWLLDSGSPASAPGRMLDASNAVPPGLDLAPASHADLSFERTIERQLVHKQSLDEVFITDYRIEGQSPGAIAAQLPRSHSLHCELENGHHDLLLLLEVSRQAMTFFGHGGLEVPKDTAFVMAALEAEIVCPEATRRGRESMTIHVPPGEARRNRKGRLRSYTIRGYGYIGERLAVVATGTAILIPSSLYERARQVPNGQPTVEEVPLVPVEPRLVGRTSPRNVVVSEPRREADRWETQVIVDTTHPSFFDHDLDHVPGMLMLEAARQAAVLAVAESGWAPGETILDRCDARLTQYAALSPPAICSVELQDPEDDGLARTARASFSQSGRDLGHIELRLRRALPAGRDKSR